MSSAHKALRLPRDIRLVYDPQVFSLSSEDPDRFVLRKSGRIQLERWDDEAGEGVAVPIGVFDSSIVNVEMAREEEALDVVMDAAGSFHEMVYASLYDFSSDELKQSVENFIFKMTDDYVLNANLLVLERVELAPEYRGHDYGLAAMEAILRAEGSSYGLAVLKAFPLQYEGSERMRQFPDEFARDTRKLQKHYARLGFKSLPRTPLMLMPRQTLWKTVLRQENE